MTRRHASPAGRPRGTGAFLVLVLAGLVGSGCRWGRPQFEHTFESPRALAEAVLAGLASGDLAGLESLPLSEREFREKVYPEMPAFGKIPTSYVWDDLRFKSRNQLRFTVARYGGRRYTVADVVFDGGVTAYQTFVVHRKPRVVVRDDVTGERRPLALFGSLIEVGGRYKLFSYVVNR